MRCGAIEGDTLHCSTCRIHNLKLPTLPFVRVRCILSAKLLNSFHGGDHGCLETGCLNAILIPGYGLTVGEVEVVAQQS